MSNRDAQGRFTAKVDLTELDKRVKRLEHNENARIKNVRRVSDQVAVIVPNGVYQFEPIPRGAGKSYGSAAYRNIVLERELVLSDSNYDDMKNSRDHWLNVSKGRFARIQDLENQLERARDENRELAKLVSKTYRENLEHRYPKVDRAREDSQLVRNALFALTDATSVTRRLTTNTVHVEYDSASSAAFGCQVLNSFTGVSASRVGFGRRRMMVEFK